MRTSYCIVLSALVGACGPEADPSLEPLETASSEETLAATASCFEASMSTVTMELRRTNGTLVYCVNSSTEYYVNFFGPSTNDYYCIGNPSGWTWLPGTFGCGYADANGDVSYNSDLRIRTNSSLPSQIRIGAATGCGLADYHADHRYYYVPKCTSSCYLECPCGSYPNYVTCQCVSAPGYGCW